MRKGLSFLGLALAGLLFLPPAASAQTAPSDTQDKSASVRTVTGCLSAGDSADEFKLTGTDGSTWEVTSKTAKLGDHLGHTVKVTGKVWHPDMHGAKEKTKEAVDPSSKEHGHLNVTDVAMVSNSCKS